MSNIAEKIHDTALKKGEEYSKSHGCSIIEEVTYGRGYKSGYIEGYNQAMQDFFKKSEEFLYLQLNNGSIECGNIERLIDDLKNHMQDESEN